MELHRVLRPGGRPALHEIMRGPRFTVRFPVPWASGQSLSYLCPPATVRELLGGPGLVELAWDDVTETTLAAMQRNLVRNLMEGRIAITRAVFERTRVGRLPS